MPGGLCVIALFGALWFPQCHAQLTSNLDAHLRSPAFSQRRSYLESANLDLTRSYIADMWGALSGIEDGGVVPEFTDAADLPTLLDDERPVVVFSQKFPKVLSGMIYEGVNYVLMVKGGDWGTAEDKPVLLGTHYDSVHSSPGVDDNGSGMAAMLEVSKSIALGGAQMKHSAIFVAFDFEEYGLDGSEQFVQKVLLPYLAHYNIPVANFQGAFILDTIMNFDDSENSQIVPDEDTFKIIFPEQYATMEERKFAGQFLLGIGRQDEKPLMDTLQTYWSTSGPGDFQDLELPLSGNEIPPAYISVITNYLRSDHASFWLEASVTDGLKAIFLTDTAEFRGTMEQCYHSACDDVNAITPQKLEFLGQTTETLIRAMQALTSTDVETTTPKKPKTSGATCQTAAALLMALATAWATCITL